MLRAAEGKVVTALSGSETVELAYGLGKLMRTGLGAHTAMLPEETSDALDPFRLPLSAIRDAEIVVVLGDEPVSHRAPLVDMWLKAAQRNGGSVVTVGADGDVQTAPGSAADALRADGELTEKIRSSERAILIWSGGGGHGGVTVGALAGELGLADKPGSGAFHLPSAPNARGVADAWACSADETAPSPQPIKLLVVSGDEAAADPNVRRLAEHAESVLAICMYGPLVRGWADLILPGTSYLERDGTYLNLEGRVQRLRRAVIPPAPDELAWLAKLAERFDVELSPYPSQIFEEISARAYGGIPFGAVGERAALPGRTPLGAAAQAAPAADTRTAGGGPLRLLRYRPLFSGPAVERVHELQFQRPAQEIELAAADASSRGIATGDLVKASSNGTSVELRARVSKSLRAGVARAAEEHVADLEAGIEVSRA
jgi:hypothetical protein